MTAAQVHKLTIKDGRRAHTVNHVALAEFHFRWPRRDRRIQTAEQLWATLLDFAYPYGSYDPAVGQLQAAGFRDAVTTSR